MRGYCQKLQSQLLLLLLFLPLVPAATLVAEPLKLSRHLAGESVHKSLEYLVDEDRSLSLPILETREKRGVNPWRPFEEARPTHGYTDAAYWLRLKIVNDSSERLHWILQHDIALAGSVEVYRMGRDGRYSFYRAGKRYPFVLRPLEHRDFVFPYLILPGVEEHIYIRLYSGSPMRLSFESWSEREFYKFKEKESPVLWIYYGFLIVMCLYNLFIFFSVRERAYFYYVLYIFVFIFVALCVNGLAFQYLWPESVWGNMYVLHLVAALTTIFFYLFVRDFAGIRRELPWYDRTMLFVVGVNILYIMSLPFFNYMYRAMFSDIVLFSSLIFCLPGIYYLAFFRKNRPAIYLAVAFTGLILTVLVGLGEGFGVIPSGFLALYSYQIGSAFEVVLLSLGLADRINVMKGELQVLNTGLEEKVKSRTIELQDSFAHITKLKEKQDGDYYLTALLVNPLQSNQNDSPIVQTEICVEQYKKFRFKKWDSEIGGDLCVTHKLNINGRNYVVFLNADAMGKSMQGAVGALVLGASIKSRLLQAHLNSERRITPEIWLEEAYQDLQKLFISFDGYMLVSMLLGLVDEELGLLYFINLEHPWLVLYRDGRAKFLEKTPSLRKVGIPNENQNLKVQLYQMKAGDKIFAGSDGKDDLELLGPGGKLKFNDDYSLFLESVNAGGGHLSDILRDLKNRGQFRDDVSLLSLSYEPPAVQESASDQVQAALLETFRAHLASGNPEQALQLIQKELNDSFLSPELVGAMRELNRLRPELLNQAEFLRLCYETFPGEDETLLELARGYQKLNQNETAIVYSRSLFLRNMEHPENLNLLGELYLEQGEVERARDMHKILKSMEGEGTRAELLLAAIMRYEEIYSNSEGASPTGAKGRQFPGNLLADAPEQEDE